MPNMKSLTKRYGPRIAERDLGGWMCAYCYRRLDPTHTAPVELTYNGYVLGGPPAFFESRSGELSPHTPHRRSVFYDDAPCIDHVVAQVRGGPRSLDNCVLACRRCNGRKGKRPIGGSL